MTHFDYFLVISCRLTLGWTLGHRKESLGGRTDCVQKKDSCSVYESAKYISPRGRRLNYSSAAKAFGPIDFVSGSPLDPVHGFWFERIKSLE